MTTEDEEKVAAQQSRGGGRRGRAPGLVHVHGGAGGGGHLVQEPAHVGGHVHMALLVHLDEGVFLQGEHDTRASANGPVKEQCTDPGHGALTLQSQCTNGDSALTVVTVYSHYSHSALMVTVH